MGKIFLGTFWKTKTSKKNIKEFSDEAETSLKVSDRPNYPYKTTLMYIPFIVIT